jgi:hypothetical protein
MANAYYPAAGATLTVDAGVWSATGRPTVRVTVNLDARLLIDLVNVAARNASHVATFGLGKPPVQVTLT